MKWKSASQEIFHGIRFRMALTFLICFGAMASLSMLLLRASLIPSFIAIEQAATGDDAERMVGGFDAQLASLELLNRDWAHWDDMYRFAEKPNPVFAASNQQPASLLNISLSLLIVFDRSGQRVGYTSIAPKTGKARDLGLFAPDKAEFLARFIRPSPTGRDCGFMEARGNLLLICWHAILRSDKSGPSMGMLVMGRDLDKDVLRQMREQSKLSFDLVPQPSAGRGETVGGEWWNITKPKYLRDSRVHATRSDDAIALDYQLYDLLDKPIASIVMRLPRELMAQGYLLFSRTAIQLGLIALTTGVLLLAAMQIWFVRPLALLQRAVVRIRRQKSWQSQVGISRRDEVGLLGEEINGLLEVIHSQVQNLEALSLTDSLTGLSNRRAFDARLLDELQRVKRTRHPLSLLLLDIDFFKQYNDYYGHPAGDRALKAVANVLVSATRHIDMDARIGGEEFAILMPDTDAAGAWRLAKRLQAELAQCAIPHLQSSVAACVTVSIGIATTDNGDDLPAYLMDRADRALYAAKNAGRNRIESA